MIWEFDWDWLGLWEVIKFFGFYEWVGGYCMMII